jgi:regulator of nonsense transcripts 2
VKIVVRKERGKDDERPQDLDKVEADEDGESSSPTSHVSAFYPPNLPPLTIYSQVDQCAHSAEVVLSHLQENLGPCEEADTEFTKELAKMVTDTSSESRKVDKKTALAMWEMVVLPPAVMLKDAGARGDSEEAGVAGSRMEIL